jgi:glycosyltransferase involved in cell wall biosynthesis
LIERCDALFVTTPTLKDSLAKHRKPIHVLPNAIDPARWRLRPRDSGEMRIGWAGSGSHIEDLLLVLPAVEKLQRRIPFRFILQGLTNRPIAEEADDVKRLMGGFGPSQRTRAETFLELAGMLRRVRYVHVPYAELDVYFDLLPRSDLDIGLCPLADTPFNRHKSALKFYEYAACGTLTVASAVGPYRDEVSAVVPNEADAWHDVLELYVRDARRREFELERQRGFVFAERSIERLSAGWVQALRQTLEIGAPASSSGTRGDGCRAPVRE